MSKYFVVSDIHSFATELKTGLSLAGFDKKNPEHILIVCGDVFDRGSETLKVYNFLKSIPKKRCILIRGNHEWLYNELLNKSFFQSHDLSNGTVRTFCDIAKIPGLTHEYFSWENDSEDSIDVRLENWKKVVAKVKESKVTKWINSDQWVNYFELDKFIFVHSFIPTKIRKGFESMQYWPTYEIPVKALTYNEDWKNSSQVEWDDATWGCPYKLFSESKAFSGEIKKGKVLVVGHWHTSAFHEYYENIYKDNEIYFGKNLIGLDGGVRYSWLGGYEHPQNVLVIDDNLVCYNRYGDKLKLKKKRSISESI